MLYLDSAASAPARAEVLEAMWPHLVNTYGNPSSIHSVGETAARTLAEARADVANTLGCRTGDVIFTSGGTEADNLAVKGIALAAAGRRRIVTTPIEHEAVLESAQYLKRIHGFEITMLPVDRHGLVAPQELANALDQDVALVSIAYANNEVGTVQPIAALAAVSRDAGVPFHTDAVQAGGWLPIRVDELGVDALSLSGHKFGTPKGIGLLAVRGRMPVEPLMHGGGQQRGRRSGTENVAGAVGLALALKLAEEERVASSARVRSIRDDIVRELLRGVPDMLITGHPTERLPHLISFCCEGVSGETVLLDLERRGIVASSGSACAAGNDEPSHVLLALGLSEDVARSSVRLSLTPSLTQEDIERVIRAVTQSVRSHLHPAM